MIRTLKIAACAMMMTSVVGVLADDRQNVVEYTLQGCIDEAMANNMKLRNADNAVIMSSEQRKEAFTKYFPSVSASGLGLASNRSLIQMDMGGMELGLVKNGLAADVVAMQPVFAGGQIVNGNRLARVGEDVSRLQRGMTADEVKLSTETYFWQIVMLKEKLKTIDQVLTQLDRVRKDAEVAVAAGVRNRNDLLQVQLRRNEMRAGRIEVENNLGVLTSLLAQHIGHMQDSIAVESPFDGKDILSVAVEDLSQYYVNPDDALLQTNEYKLLGKQVEAERLQYKQAVGKNMPSVAIGGGYVYNNLMDKSVNRLVGMVSVTVPVTQWWGGSHDMKRQKLKAQNAENELLDQSQLLVVRMQKAWSGMTDAYRKVEIAAESIAQSEENLRLNMDYYRAGTATVSDMLDAQTLYQQSRDQYVEAYTQYEVRKSEYLQSTGR